MTAHGGTGHQHGHRHRADTQGPHGGDLRSALEHIDAANDILRHVQDGEESGARWMDLETARRSLHGAAIAVVDCGLQSGREVTRAVDR